MAGDVAETISKTENLGKDKASNNGITADNATATDAAHKTSTIEFAESKVSVTADSTAKSLDLSQFDQNFTVDVDGSTQAFTNSQSALISNAGDAGIGDAINDMDSAGSDSTALKGTASATDGKLSSADSKNTKDITKVNMHCKMPPMKVQIIKSKSSTSMWVTTFTSSTLARLPVALLVLQSKTLHQ